MNSTHASGPVIVIPKADRRGRVSSPEDVHVVASDELKQAAADVQRLLVELRQARARLELLMDGRLQ